MFAILLVLGISLYIFSRHRGRGLLRRYPGRYAIVLGATGGLGTSFCKRLLDEGYSLIVSGRSLQSISGLKSRLDVPDNKLVPFPYDASSATIGDFSTKLNELLTIHAIDQDDIAVVVMAAGFGEYSSSRTRPSSTSYLCSIAILSFRLKSQTTFTNSSALGIKSPVTALH